MPTAVPAWLDVIDRSAQLLALTEALQSLRSAVVRGGRGSAGVLIAGLAARAMHRPVLLVVAHLDEADDALDDLELLPELRVARFGAIEASVGGPSGKAGGTGSSPVNLDIVAERLALVEQLTEGQWSGEPGVIVAPIQALMQSVPKPEALDELSLTLRVDEDLPPGRLLDWLDRAGYSRQDAIEQPGDVAVRGGIIDIFPVAGRCMTQAGEPGPISPIRLDYFGDTIESIHRVEVDTLGSEESLTSCNLLGNLSPQAEALQQTTDLLALLPGAGECFPMLHETLELSEQARGYFERLTDASGILPPTDLLRRLTARPHAELNSYADGSDPQAVRIDLPVQPLPSFDQDARSAILDIGELAGPSDHQVTVLCSKPAEMQRLGELLQEHVPDQQANISVDLGLLHHGFVWMDESQADPVARYLVPHHELFHRYTTRRRVRRVMAATANASDAFLDLDLGDIVVHVDHGIARFTGLKQITRGEKAGEYLSLEFADTALLHVPATQIDLIQKYVGGFEGRPPLSVLGGKRWKKQKESVAEAVKDLAAELLRVQAARQTQPGIRYPQDTAWQAEFEAEFPYDETDDQLAAIAAIKKNMSDETPMDRLICGDVGFGKTEVAIRAAFKAVEYGKQVAVLVPTTVLAEQHERTFRGRFADYPFRIESISRFKTAKESRGTLDAVKQGQVDVLIGTHRLLSKDVKFNDLGLVIIDEEQRFGVEHKNKLLEYRLTADVLTLSATPIPRTLHMSMVGLRDISSLTTPPVDRRAIVTEVVPYDEGRIKQALIRELSREGQIYFVHNRVHNIQSIADDLQKLVPDARIIVGHGQMPPKMLEEVMLKFMRREADILVATTIIESGIDIPTANTMFINRADHFGLAELHQLRGRVGRYKHRAYCYMLLPPDRTVSEVAAKRLKAIEDYSMLGAGFKISMRDLEIRGAGNLLGAEQSGHIAAVGYEMYCLLLEQETKKLRREPIIEASKTHLELPAPKGGASLPRRFIRSDKHRMDAYRRLTRASTLEQLDAVEKDLVDAYGEPPGPVKYLLQLTEVRIAASSMRIDRIKLEGPDLIFTAGKAELIKPIFESAPGRATVLDEQTLYWRPPGNYLSEPGTLIAVLRKLLVRPMREAAQNAASDTDGVVRKLPSLAV
jgi:transcription-repair coupling factor (superfamily II helicase)